jgi:hypothetical protein
VQDWLLISYACDVTVAFYKARLRNAGIEAATAAIPFQKLECRS